MSDKTKKQHYVPKCYLKAWCKSEKLQVSVFDKELDSERINNIEDVASERYFYDNDSDDFLRKLVKKGINVDEYENHQVIEKSLAREIDTPFATLVQDIIDNASKATPWYINNCYFIKKDQIDFLSSYLAIQFVRTKSIRNRIIDSSNTLKQALFDMGFEASINNDIEINKESAKNIHLNMLLDNNHLFEIKTLFRGFSWLLCINRTSKKLYTSDHPICTIGHIKDSVLSMNGLASKGVEVIYPLSPDLLLIMIDSGFHKQFQKYDRKYFEIKDTNRIDYYNSIIAIQALRCVFSCDGDFSILEKMKKQDPVVFKRPQIELRWGEKKYYPERNK